MPTLALDPSVLRKAAKLALYQRSFSTFAARSLSIKPKGIVGAPIRPFLLNPPQQGADAVVERQLKEMGYIRFRWLKVRQPGGSTYAEARGFHIAALQPNVSALTIAQDDKTAAHIFGITKLFYDMLEADVKPAYRYSTKKEITLENPDERTRATWPGLRSKITFDTAKNVHAGTGQTLSVVHLSEAAKYVNPETVWQSLAPSVPLAAGTCIIDESAPFPTGEWFRDRCERAKSGKDGYAYFFGPWYLSPEYAIPTLKGELLKLDFEEKSLVKLYQVTPAQLKFRRYKIEEFGGDALAVQFFNSEYPSDEESCWISTDLQAFDPRKLHEAKAQVRGPLRVCKIFPGPQFLDARDGDLSLWEEPEPGEMYDLGADVATGSAADWSVAEVIKRRTKEQVAEYRAKLGPIDYAEQLFWLGKYYNTAQIGCEVEGIGFATNEHLQKLGYGNIYIWRYRGQAVPTLSKFSGWKTQPDTKKYMVAVGRHLLVHDELTIRSSVLLNEMRLFCTYPTETGLGYGAAAGAHDDCVMAYLIALVISADESFGVMGRQMQVIKEKLEPRWEGLYDDWDGPSKDTGARALSDTLKGWK